MSDKGIVASITLRRGALRFAALGVACILAVLPSAGRADVTWSVANGAGCATGSGTLAFEKVTELDSLTLAPTGDAIAFSGAGLLFTNAAATVTLAGTAGASGSFDLPIVATNDIAFGLESSQARTWNDGFLAVSSDAATTLLDNQQLKDWTIDSGRFGGASVTIQGAVAEPLHIVRGDGWLTAQLQTMEGQYAKCVKVRLEQRGTDVVGWCVYAKYAARAEYGTDFDAYGTDTSLAYSTTTGGYGVTEINLVTEGDMARHMTLKQPLRAGGAISVGESLTVTADGSGILGADNVVTNPIVLNGTLVVTNARQVVFSNGWSGTSGRLVVGGCPFHSEKAEYAFDGMVSKSTWRVVAENAYLTALTNVIVTHYAGTSIKETPNPDGQTFHLRWTNDTLVCQCQTVDGSWLKCVYLAFRQNGDNVEAHTSEGWYATAAQVARGVDFDTLTQVSGTPGSGERRSYALAEKSTDGAYGVGGILLQFDQRPDAGSPAVQITYPTVNAHPYMDIVQHGGTGIVTCTNGLPAAGTYTVNGGTLRLTVKNCKQGITAAARSCLLVQNGLLTVEEINQTDPNTTSVVLDNSELRILSGSSDGNNYFNDLELRNGSRITGNSTRHTYSRNCTWKVTGQGASRCDVPVRIADTGGKTIVFDVEDTTGDAAADLVLSCGFQAFVQADHDKWYLYKRGVGTMALEAACTWRSDYPISLEAGTVSVTKRAILPQDGPISFDGGALALADGTANTAGVFRVSADSRIDLGEGATLAVADSSTATWKTDARLWVSGPFVRAGERTGLRFGTSATLDAARLKVVRYNECRVCQDAEGWIRPCGNGFRVIFR